jgi:hypothetical protein
MAGFSRFVGGFGHLATRFSRFAEALVASQASLVV